MLEKGESGLRCRLPAVRRTASQFRLAAWAFSKSPSDSSTLRILARFSGLGGTRGSRHTGSSNPISAMAAFTGMGLDSTKLISISGRYLRCNSRAAERSEEHTSELQSRQYL